MISQDDLRAKLHEENSDFKANLNEDNTLLLDTIDTSIVFKRETSNVIGMQNQKMFSWEMKVRFFFDDFFCEQEFSI